MHIALICAFEKEISLLRDEMESPHDKVLAGVPVTQGILHGHTVTLLLSGVGKSNAAAATQLAVLTCSPDYILNIGLAGNCSDLPLGGAVVADSLVYHDFRMDFAAEDPPFLQVYMPEASLIRLAVASCTALKIPNRYGMVATGDQFIESSAVRADIIARTGCACVEMEAAAIAHIAHKNQIPYAVIKIMSDNADEHAHVDFNATLPLGAYCDRSVAILLDMIGKL